MIPDLTQRTRRVLPTTRIRWMGLACLAMMLAEAPVAARAETPTAGGDARPLTLEGQAALRERLARRVLLVQAWPAPGPLEDPDLVPARIGMAAVVQRDGRVEIWTAAGLVADALRIEVSAADDGQPCRARVVEVRDADALARLEGDGVCLAVGEAPEPAPPEACEDGRPLTFVVPTGHGGLVVGHTVVAGPEAPPLESLVIVPGRLPLGAPLFDPGDRPAAIVLRPHVARTDRVLAAPLTPRPGNGGIEAARPTDPGRPPVDASKDTGLTPEAPTNLPVMDLE